MSAVHISGSHPLSRIIATIGSTTRVAEVLDRAAADMVTAADCRAVSIYVWDHALERLSLKAATPPGRLPPARAEVGLGEGIVGAAALKRETVFGPASATVEPSLAIPIAARQDHLLGVLCLVGTDSRGFSSDTTVVAHDVAQLLAVAIEHRRLHERTRKIGQLLEAIELLADSVAPESTLLTTLDAVVGLGLQIAEASACAVYLRDRHRTELRLGAVYPHGSRLPAVWPDGPFWHRAASGTGARQADLAESASEASAVREQGFRSMVLAPAILGSDRLGLLLALDAEPRLFGDEELGLFDRLAQVVAIVVRNRRTLDALTERTGPTDLLWDLLCPSDAQAGSVIARAQKLGFDVARPRLVLVAATGSRPAADRLRRQLLERDRGTLIDVVEGRLVAVGCARTFAELDVGSLSAGISRLCSDRARYPEAYREAQEALEVGAKLFGQGQLISFGDLGSYRFVPALIQSGLTHDDEYQLVSGLPDELLRTLEAYLDSGGNTAQAAKQLFLHRNTLRQRLDKINAFLGVDLTVTKTWLFLQLATKTARMARLGEHRCPDGAPPADRRPNHVDPKASEALRRLPIAVRTQDGQPSVSLATNGSRGRAWRSQETAQTGPR